MDYDAYKAARLAAVIEQQQQEENRRRFEAGQREATPQGRLKAEHPLAYFGLCLLAIIVVGLIMFALFGNHAGHQGLLGP